MAKVAPGGERAGKEEEQEEEGEKGGVQEF
jgi:hypothetical protein